MRMSRNFFWGISKSLSGTFRPNQYASSLIRIFTSWTYKSINLNQFAVWYPLGINYRSPLFGVTASTIYIKNSRKSQRNYYIAPDTVITRKWLTNYSWTVLSQQLRREVNLRYCNGFPKNKSPRKKRRLKKRRLTRHGKISRKGFFAQSQGSILIKLKNPSLFWKNCIVVLTFR